MRPFFLTTEISTLRVGLSLCLKTDFVTTKLLLSNGECSCENSAPYKAHNQTPRAGLMKR